MSVVLSHPVYGHLLQQPREVIQTGSQFFCWLQAEDNTTHNYPVCVCVLITFKIYFLNNSQVQLTLEQQEGQKSVCDF